VSPSGPAAVLTQTLDRTPARSADAVGLQRRLTPGQRLHWKPIERSAPGTTEVEIAVAATGLNFRDLMRTLSLLPDDIIEQDAAGPSLGCECTGEITRVGAVVHHLRPGDRVAAFAAAAFATHVTVAADQVAKLPPGIEQIGLSQKSSAISKAAIIRNRREFPLQAKQGAFSLGACGDPVFPAREGFGRPGAKESLHSG
jgi:hypothetical protein